MLSDDLVGQEEEQRRNGEAQGLGGLQIDDELEFHRLDLKYHCDRFLHVFCIKADIVGDAPEQIRQARPRGHEAPIVHRVLGAQRLKEWFHLLGQSLEKADVEGRGRDGRAHVTHDPEWLQHELQARRV